LDPLEEDGTIIEYIDNSKNKYDIDIQFKRGILNKLDDQGILELLGLITHVSENLTVISFNGKTVWTPSYEELITKFCEWRLNWYVKRYERLANNLKIDIQRYKDILRAIDKDVGGLAKKIRSRKELNEYLKAIQIVYIDYIANFPIYRFTIEEKQHVENKLKDAEALLQEYNDLLKDKNKRRIVYIKELKEILAKYNKGYYT